MKELPNPLQSLNSLGDGITTKIAGKISSKISEIQKLNKFVKLFPLNKNAKSKKRLKRIKALRKVLAEERVITETSRVAKKSAIQVYVARDLSEIKEAQRLRYRVFAEEMGASLPYNAEGLDVDLFDAYCDHLIVRDTETLQVVGTYRVLPPEQAKIIGRLYSESEFDLARLQHLLPKTVEIGRSCVHEDYRSGGVIMALWAGLGLGIATCGIGTLGWACLDFAALTALHHACDAIGHLVGARQNKQNASSAQCLDHLH